jgi:chromosome segregation ATPase
MYLAKEKELYDQWFKQSADGKIYAVLGKLHGTDFTDTPAATDGVFCTGTLAEEAERMLEEHPQIFDAIENSPKSLLEFLERTGLDKKLESARVAGLQAAKDKEIAELRAAKEKEIAELKGENEKFAAQVKDLTADIDAKALAFDGATATIKQLEAKCAETEKALADVQAALAAEQERYREQVGAALQQPKSALSGLHGRDLAVAALAARG